jgi:hypothetical protein
MAHRRDLLLSFLLRSPFEPSCGRTRRANQVFVLGAPIALLGANALKNLPHEKTNFMKLIKTVATFKTRP